MRRGLNAVMSVQSALTILSEAEAKECLVAFSCGKDSCAVLDLCARHFKRVVAFHMYFLPGLRFIEEQLSAARRRWPRVEFIQIPHWATASALKSGRFGWGSLAADALDEWKVADAYALVRAETKIKLIATGERLNDSAQRRRRILYDNQKQIIRPIAQWNTAEVLSYLKLQGIPLPPSDGSKTFGIGLDPSALVYCWNNYRDDFEKIEAVFPFVAAAVWREKFYGPWNTKKRRGINGKK